MDKLFLRNFDIFSNKDSTINIERLCEDDGDGTAECPFKADCRFKEIKSGENRQEIIECISNCDETDIVQFPLTKFPGTTSDISQIGKKRKKSDSSCLLFTFHKKIPCIYVRVRSLSLAPSDTRSGSRAR